MSAADYDINLPYGATSKPYSSSHPHRGNDRACPAGTPVVIGSTTIGLTGATGYVFGAHLHIQEWKGDYATTRKPQNEFKGGVVVNVDTVGTYPNNKNDGTQGDGTFGKFITIRCSDGWNTTYCHLSKINVKVGQVISGTATGGNMTKAEATSLVTGGYKSLLGRKPDAGGLANYVGHLTSGRYTPEKVLAELASSAESKAYFAKPYQKTIAAKDAEIAKLKASQGTGNPQDAADASKWRQFLNLLPFVKK